MSVNIGDMYHVSWRNGSKHIGEVIEKRPLKSIRDELTIKQKKQLVEDQQGKPHAKLPLQSASQQEEEGMRMNLTNGNVILDKYFKADTADLAMDKCEYYIHFPGFDRRLDEWVFLDRIDLQAGLVTPAELDSLHGNGGFTNINNSSSSGGGLAGNGSSQKKKHPRFLGGLIDSQNAGVDEDGNPLPLNEKEEKDAKIAKLEKEAEEITKVKNIHKISIGKYSVECWYFSPYPEEYYSDDTESLYICEYCLKYTKSQSALVRHAANCSLKAPPGKEIYREDKVCMYEIDGKDQRIYCQNLCLLSKLFLDHKTLYYDVDPFLFYVLCEVQESGEANIVGYFSKEKQSTENNLACILTFPQYQRKGYGKLLISISYELTKLENTTGSPEKPLSDLGKISYRSYWSFVIGRVLCDTQTVNVMEIMKQTGIKYDDVISTLHSMNILKTWKGQHLISITQAFLDEQRMAAKRIRLCNPSCLNWTPPEEEKIPLK